MSAEAKDMAQTSVLIVEDSAIVALHLRKMVVDLGYSAIGPVATGEQAIAMAAAGAPDLILMDIQLAGAMDGIAAAGRIHSTTDVPIVFLTSYAQDPLLHRAKIIAPYGYLLKPISQRELAATIEMAFYRHRLDRQLQEHKDALQKAHDQLEQRVRERTADLHQANQNLRQEIENRAEIEIALQKSNRMLQASYLEQSHFISGLDMEVLFGLVLDQFLALTNSRLGFIGELLPAPDGDLHLNTFAATGIGRHEATRGPSATGCSTGPEIGNLRTIYAAVLRNGHAVIANDPAPVPRHGEMSETDPPLTAFLGLPIHYGQEMVGIVGLANRPGGYQDNLVEYLSPFLITCGNILEAGRNKKRREDAEKSLRESEERYRRITEGLTDYLFTVRIRDGKAVETTHNPACEMVTGYTPEEYAADPNLWLSMVVAEDRSRVTGLIERTLAGEKVPTFEHRIIHKDGQICWVSGKLIPQYDSAGKLVAYDGVIKDITERKRAEERMYNSKASLSMAIDGISDPLIMMDSKFRLKRLNRAAKAYYGLTNFQEVIGKPCYEAFRGRTSPCEECVRALSELRGSAGSYERPGLMDPDRLEQVYVDVVRDELGAPKACIVRIHDVTQERMVDRQLIQSEKLASLGLLLAGIAHEINNPNNFIYFNAPILRSYLQFLLPIVDEYVAVHPDLQAFGRPYANFREDCFKLLDNIEHGSTRINQIVGNLREFVRERGKGERRRVDLKQVIEKGISICHGRIKKAVKNFEMHIPDGLPTLLIDPLALEQIVVNLLINAAQAADKEDSWVKLTITLQNETDSEVIAEVSDNGCGMDSATRKKVFDPFFTTKAVGVGTGLGLSICHRLITELGGRIEVKSEPGKGSTFRVVLPVELS